MPPEQAESLQCSVCDIFIERGPECLLTLRVTTGHVPILSCTGGFWRRQGREWGGSGGSRGLPLSQPPPLPAAETSTMPPACHQGRGTDGTVSRMIGPYRQGPTAPIWGSLNARPPHFQIAPICCICSAPSPPHPPISGVGRRPSWQDWAGAVPTVAGLGQPGYGSGMDTVSQAGPPSGAVGRVLAALWGLQGPGLQGRGIRAL